jgi:hypothetical protein
LQQANTQQQLPPKVQLLQHKEAAAALQHPAPATPVHPAKASSIVLQVSDAAAAVALAAGKQLVAENASAACDVSPHETSTSSEQTHDGMQDSPRELAREPLSSWPSSSTDSICQQQLLYLQQQQHGKPGAGAMQQRHAAPAAVASSWPSSPLPASAL